MNSGVAHFRGVGYLAHKAQPYAGPDIWPQKKIAVFTMQSARVLDEIEHRISKDETRLTNVPPQLSPYDLKKILDRDKEGGATEIIELKKILGNSRNWRGEVLLVN